MKKIVGRWCVTRRWRGEHSTGGGAGADHVLIIFLGFSHTAVGIKLPRSLRRPGVVHSGTWVWPLVKSESTCLQIKIPP